MPNKLATKIIGVLLLGGSVVLVRPHWIEYRAVDACLDSGGAFNYAAQECDYVQSHPYIPPYSKHGWSVVASGMLGVAGLVLLFTSRDKRKSNGR